MNPKKWKNKKGEAFNLIIITWVVFILLVGLGTVYSFTNTSGVFIGEPNKIMGRYIASVLPLFLTTGALGLSLYTPRTDRKELIFSLLCSLFLAFLPTDKMIAGFDTLSTNIIFTPKYAYIVGLLPFSIPEIFIRGLLVSFPFLFYLSRRRLRWRYIFLLLLMFFLVNSGVATLSLYIGSQDAGEYMNVALWMRSTTPEESVIFFDKRPDDPEDKLFWMIEAVKFWTDNKVIVGNVYDTKEKPNYIISSHKLGFPLIFELKAEEGVFKPRKEVIYLYKFKR